MKSQSKAIAKTPLRVIEGGKPPIHIPALRDVPMPFADDGIGRRAIDIKPRDQEWTWWPWYPTGQISVLAGSGGVGKGLYFSDIASRISRGDDWPLEDERAPLGNVVWCEEEDDLDTTVVPRLMAAGANLKRFKFPKSADEFDQKFTRSYIADNDVRLIVLSPLLSFIGVRRYTDDQEVRAGLRRLKARVKGTQCAVIGIMHPNKKMDAAAIERLLGSSAFRNFVRAVAFLKEEAGEEVRVMHGKHNLGPKADDLLFTKVNRRSDKPKGAYWGIDWSRAQENAEPNSAFKLTDNDDNDPSAREWLLGCLRDKRRKECKAIFAEAEKHSHTESALKAAKKRLGARIEHEHEGFGKDRIDYWKLK